jgi:type II secretory pathway pseudopilin PulG
MRRTLEILAVIAVAILIAMAFHAWLASHDEQLRMQATIASQKQQLDAADLRERARATALDQTLAQIQKLKRDTQTPEEILKQLPQYLSLPQPITLNSPPADDDPQAAATSAAKQGKNEKGTGFRLFGKRWLARKPTPADGEERASSTAKNSLPSATASSGVDSESNEGAGRDRSQNQNQTAAFHATAQTTGSVAGKNEVKSLPVVGAAVELPDAANSARATSSIEHKPPPAGQNASGPSSVQIPAADLKSLYDNVQDCRSCQAQLAAAQQNRTDDAAKLTAMTRERDAAVTAAKGGSFWRRFRHNGEWFALGAAAGAAGSAVFCRSGHCR